MDYSVEVTVTGFAADAQLIAPAGLPSPYGCPVGVTVDGGAARVVSEQASGQSALGVAPEADAVTFRYRFIDAPGRYPEAMFRPTPSRFTRATDALRAEALDLAGTGDPLTRARHIACGVAERFTYGHPEVRFTDGKDEVPALGCGLTEGSCVDINTYFIAALRASGIEAGYATGYFFPSEKRDWCSDGHCWVVTRIGGATQEWDIAHHLKLGSRNVHPALNPKPGFRVALAHSMGLTFPAVGLVDLKALIEPMAVTGGRAHHLVGNRIRLTHPTLVASAKWQAAR
ncbi:MAG: transglutaminase domain-containing protein [Tabrizicola sp.]|nr:transglutaminase domain-containing protein [Tabrizicola sp.]